MPAGTCLRLQLADATILFTSIRLRLIHAASLFPTKAALDESVRCH